VGLITAGVDWTEVEGRAIDIMPNEVMYGNVNQYYFGHFANANARKCRSRAVWVRFGTRMPTVRDTD